jgi:hypothetical protein
VLVVLVVLVVFGSGGSVVGGEGRRVLSIVRCL